MVESVLADTKEELGESRRLRLRLDSAVGSRRDEDGVAAAAMRYDTLALQCVTERALRTFHRRPRSNPSCFS